MTDYEAHKLVMETPQRLKRVAELERQLAEAEAEIELLTAALVSIKTHMELASNGMAKMSSVWNIANRVLDKTND